jgi:DNA-binding MarR family transcriptional regulator
LHHARSRIDRRAVRISPTDKGREIHEIVSALYDKHIATVEQIGGISSEEFARLIYRSSGSSASGPIR